MSESIRPHGLARDRQPVSDAGRRFQATVGTFEREVDRGTMDALVRWVEDRYADELRERPSKHVYVKRLPREITDRIDRLRDSPVLRSAILRQFGPGHVIVPLKHTDELYISHYNKDGGGDQGLYSKHYDGNLRFLPVGAVVRALIYLQSAGTYKVVFGDSRVERAFRTYEFGLLDFHRELHWVEGEYDPTDVQRILLKCNYLVAPKDAVLWTRFLLAANTGVFYVVKAAMEYSKSPRTPVQRFVGWLCNGFRLMNNVHPIVPLVVVAGALVAAVWGIVAALA